MMVRAFAYSTVVILLLGAAPTRAAKKNVRVVATLRVDKGGVWLLAKTMRLRLLQRSAGYFKAFHGKRVVAVGRRAPGKRFRLHTLKLRRHKRPSAGPIQLGPRARYCGRFVKKRVPHGSKGTGELVTYFVSARGKRFIARAPSTPRGHVGVSGRSYKLSPYVAHLGGPRLWVDRVDTRGTCARIKEPARKRR